MLRRRALAWSLVPFFLASCGGSSRHDSSSGSSSTDTIGPQIALAWPARARGFAAPGAATAALITLPGAGVNGVDLTQVVARPDGAVAITKTYQLSVAVHPGRHLLRVDFLAEASSTSASLATAATNVMVTNRGTIKTLDGKNLGTVAYGSNVTGLTILVGQAVEIGQTIDPVVTATTTTGIVALKPGSVTLSLSTGAELLKVNADGSITGLSVGNATLTASTDGVTSAATSITVSAAPVVARSLALATADLVFDPVRSAVWVASGNSVTPFDPTSASLGTPIALPAAPTTLALSDDGTTLYAGLQSLGTVRRIDLTTNTPGASFTLPNSEFGGASYAQQMVVQPGSVSTLAIVRRGVNGGFVGLGVYDDGTARPSALSLINSPRSLWLGPSRLLAYPDSSGVDDVAVDANGATISRTVATQADLTRPLVPSGGRLYAANGIVLDSTTLESIGAFTVLSSTSPNVLCGPAVDATRKRAYYVEIGYGKDSNRLHVYDTESYAEIANRRISGLTVSSLPDYGFDVRATLVGNRLLFRLSDQIVVLDGVSSL